MLRQRQEAQLRWDGSADGHRQEPSGQSDGAQGLKPRSTVLQRKARGRGPERSAHSHCPLYRDHSRLIHLLHLRRRMSSAVMRRPQHASDYTGTVS